MIAKSMLTLNIHEVKEGTCCLTGKETDVLVCTTEDGFLNESPISIKALLQLAKMKTGQQKKVPDAIPVLPNGEAE
jgi:hypothetical protein